MKHKWRDKMDKKVRGKKPRIFSTPMILAVCNRRLIVLD